MTKLAPPPATAAGPYPDPGSIFAGTAGTYDRYRPAHPPLLLDHLAALAGDGTVLDLGCGTGRVALALAERGIRVAGVDPSVEMLDAARRRAKAADRHAIAWLQGTAERLDRVRELPAPLAGAVVADAFHWMDKAVALEQLDASVAPGGFVALLCARAPGTPKPWWEALVDRVRERHLGARAHAGPHALYTEQHPDHESALRRSAFRRITAIRCDYALDYALDELVALQHTHAYSSDPVLGARREAFDAELRAALGAAEPAGRFRAVMQAHLLVGTRTAQRGEAA